MQVKNLLDDSEIPANVRGAMTCIKNLKGNFLNSHSTELDIQPERPISAVSKVDVLTSSMQLCRYLVDSRRGDAEKIVRVVSI